MEKSSKLRRAIVGESTKYLLHTKLYGKFVEIKTGDCRGKYKVSIEDSVTKRVTYNNNFI